MRRHKDTIPEQELKICLSLQVVRGLMCPADEVYLDLTLLGAFSLFDFFQAQLYSDRQRVVL
jgi:hypothetical protein